MRIRLLQMVIVVISVAIGPVVVSAASASCPPNCGKDSPP